ncbi:hypothetical protein [Haladaptatus halobius]|uniref:hypothetical protein n=1 Tax=Haladaptatus halobius TaxID=2884875 RepID=UPI001D0AC9F4|nr:hypothetical protein [Haladaptatus halobius]
MVPSPDGVRRLYAALLPIEGTTNAQLGPSSSVRIRTVPKGDLFSGLGGMERA